VKFTRGRTRPGRHARDDRPRRSEAGPPRSLAEELGIADGRDGGDAAGRDRPVDPPAPGAPAGPYDAGEGPPDLRRLDLGSLRIPAVAGVDVRVQANPDGAVQQVVLVHEGSLLQLAVFAAPRSEGIWDEIRADIRRSLFTEGVAAEEIPGSYGVELRARVRTQEGLRDLRFVGVDGPRWMVQGVFQGPAAVDESRAGPLTECLRGLVVARGEEARPVREPLPLRLPADMPAPGSGQGSGGAPVGAAADGPAGAQPGGLAGPSAAARGMVIPVPGPAGGAVPGPAASGSAPAGAPPGARSELASPAAPARPAQPAPPSGAAVRRKPSPRPRRGP